ncbi:hypothetical protein ATE84_3453 [Aquimarina sp. MAR_2010_214]|uniref:hypothetical protein n=1 Tax=Aquimarina sp. MAR_2010_214 TaxID=1250026 RepID=UPI000C70507C|nr:hypothetical protein [Aquimarina sp. MAR_2010_214]PKV51368.1 hypothetical protein ATE84_3453 [Aquimarina sp. MAR_2010_214]
MRNKILNLIILLFCSLCFSQKEITWQDLSKVNFEDKYFPAYGDYFLYPEFLPSVKALEGKLITIKGYFLNIDSESNLYILSKGPMSSCYFCGQGGPETAVELQFMNKQKFKTDNIVAITGILKLNKDDIEHFNYILTECKGKLIK